MDEITLTNRKCGLHSDKPTKIDPAAELGRDKNISGRVGGDQNRPKRRVNNGFAFIC